jgi:hypothetical protein
MVTTVLDIDFSFLYNSQTDFGVIQPPVEWAPGSFPGVNFVGA